MNENIEQNKMNASKTLTLKYFAILREQSGLSDEKIHTDAATPLALYNEMAERFSFTLPANRVRVAINDRFEDMSAILNDGDAVVFIPPVAGG